MKWKITILFYESRYVFSRDLLKWICVVGIQFKYGFYYYIVFSNSHKKCLTLYSVKQTFWIKSWEDTNCTWWLTLAGLVRLVECLTEEREVEGSIPGVEPILGVLK